MNDFQRKITYLHTILSKTQIGIHIGMIQKKLIKLVFKSEMQKGSFELKVKILVANLTTEK